MKTLEEILQDATAIIDLDANTPTGTDLELRTNYANQAIYDATATTQLREFTREYVTGITGPTISLPDDFREAQENPFTLESGSWFEHELREVEEKYHEHDNSNYGYIMGDSSNGYNLILNNSTSGTTLSLIYQKYPDGFTDLDSVCELSDPQYVVRKIESYVLYSRSDDRFRVAEERANLALMNMAGRRSKGNVPGPKDTKSKYSNPLSNF